MMKTALLIFAFVACTYAEDLVASVVLTPDPGFKDQNVMGTLKLVQNAANKTVTVTGSISGLSKDALHGFHVHAKGDLSEGCKSAGPHFNPEKVKHGAPNDTVRHVGDLGNIKSNAEGVAEVNIVDSVIALSGANSVIGRAIVVHSMEDDLGKGNSTLSKDTGNAGDRWACGVIGIVSPEGSWPSSASALVESGFLLFLLAITSYGLTLIF